MNSQTRKSDYDLSLITQLSHDEHHPKKLDRAGQQKVAAILSVINDVRQRICADMRVVVYLLWVLDWTAVYVKMRPFLKPGHILKRPTPLLNFFS